MRGSGQRGDTTRQQPLRDKEASEPSEAVSFRVDGLNLVRHTGKILTPATLPPMLKNPRSESETDQTAVLTLQFDLNADAATLNGYLEVLAETLTLVQALYDEALKDETPDLPRRRSGR